MMHQLNMPTKVVANCSKMTFRIFWQSFIQVATLIIVSRQLYIVKPKFIPTIIELSPTYMYSVEDTSFSNDLEHYVLFIEPHETNILILQNQKRLNKLTSK